jgi:hypothetical protein
MDSGRLWLDLVGDSSPPSGVMEPPLLTIPPPAHGEVGRTKSKDFLIPGNDDGPSTGRKGCGDDGILPRSSTCG